MSVELVVLQPTRVQVINELLAALPAAALHVALAEHTEQQLGLVEPRGVRCRQEHADVQIEGTQQGGRLLCDVGRGSIPDRDRWGCRSAMRRMSETVECAIFGTSPRSAATFARLRIDQRPMRRRRKRVIPGEQRGCPS